MHSQDVRLGCRDSNTVTLQTARLLSSKWTKTTTDWKRKVIGTGFFFLGNSFYSRNVDVVHGGLYSPDIPSLKTTIAIDTTFIIAILFSVTLFHYLLPSLFQV